MVIPAEEINPLLELIKIIENVKNKEKNATIKNNGSAPCWLGSVKYMIEIQANHKNNVIRKVGRKFFLSFTSFFLSIIFRLIAI
jgi:hypothetical protein